jgi:hypothetical protein
MANRGLYIWDLRTGELIMKDDTAMPQIASFMFMDERYIGYGQCDGAVTVFDWSSRTKLEVVGSYHAHEGDVSVRACEGSTTKQPDWHRTCPM